MKTGASNTNGKTEGMLDALLDIHDLADEVDGALQDSWVELEAVVNETIYANLQKALNCATKIIRKVEEGVGGTDVLCTLMDARWEKEKGRPGD